MSVPKKSSPSVDETIEKLEIIGDAHRKISLKYTDACVTRAIEARKAKKLGLTNQRIADALGITESAVRSLIRRSGGFNTMSKVDCSYCMDFWVATGSCPKCGMTQVGDQ